MCRSVSKLVNGGDRGGSCGHNAQRAREPDGRRKVEKSF